MKRTLIAIGDISLYAVQTIGAMNVIAGAIALAIVLVLAVIAPAMDAPEHELEQRTADAVADLGREQADPPLRLSIPIQPRGDVHAAAFLAVPNGDQP